jgi:hypothetical protein
MIKQFFSGLIALSVFLGLAGQAKAQPTYAFTTLDPPGSFTTRAGGINASGQIVGE